MNTYTAKSTRRTARPRNPDYTTPFGVGLWSSLEARTNLQAATLAAMDEAAFARLSELAPCARAIVPRYTNKRRTRVAVYALDWRNLGCVRIRVGSARRTPKGWVVCE